MAMNTLTVYDNSIGSDYLTNIATITVLLVVTKLLYNVGKYALKLPIISTSMQKILLLQFIIISNYYKVNFTIRSRLNDTLGLESAIKKISIDW